MERRAVRWAAPAAIALLYVAAAIALPDGLSFRGGEDGGGGIVIPDLPGVFDVVLVASFLLLSVAAVAVLLSISIRNDPTRRSRRKSPAAVLVLLVLLCFLAVLIALNRDGARQGAPADRTTIEDSAPGGVAPDETRSSRALGNLLAVAIALGLGGAAVLAWRYGRSQVPSEVRIEAFEERLLTEIDASIDDLGAISDPRAAVVACYGRLQRLARWSGAEVRACDTANEVLDALTRRSSAVAPEAARLVALFQRARFSPHPVGESERRLALEALAGVRARLGAAE